MPNPVEAARQRMQQEATHELARLRTKPTKTPWLRACAHDPKKASAKVGRCFRRLHAHGLIAKTPRTRHWRVRAYGHPAMGTSLCLREHHFPNVYATAATA